MKQISFWGAGGDSQTFFDLLPRILEMWFLLHGPTIAVFSPLTINCVQYDIGAIYIGGSTLAARVSGVRIAGPRSLGDLMTDVSPHTATDMSTLLSE
jgi:hypothetical protein